MKKNVQADKQFVKKSNLAVYDATIHWCVCFTDNLALIDVNKITPCTLLGTVEWHDLNKKEYLKFGARTQLSLQTGAGELVGCHISHLC